MQPSASVSTNGVPSQGCGGGAIRRFKGRKFGVSSQVKIFSLGKQSLQLLQQL